MVSIQKLGFKTASQRVWYHTYILPRQRTFQRNFPYFPARNASSFLLVRQEHCRIARRNQQECRRHFMTDSIPSLLVPPLVFLALLVSLWTYKCMMTVIFQDKIIYMPYMPPFARSEKVEDYSPSSGVDWAEQQISSLDGTKIWLCIGRIGNKDKSHQLSKKTVICYFQGNGSSPPPRIPLLSSTLRTINTYFKDDAHSYVIVALSYRGYWKSSGRATEVGIRKDAQAMLEWVLKAYHGSDIILWGQSIGAGVACQAAAERSAEHPSMELSALILETPFTNIKNMLVALYPQKWLPYQYLWPFLWNHWDMRAALQSIARQRRPPVLLLTAKRDEVVPAEETARVDALLSEFGFNKTRYDVFGALHTDASTRREGQEAIARFVFDVSSRQGSP